MADRPGTSPAAWDSTSEEEEAEPEPKPESDPKSNPMLPFRKGLRAFKLFGLPLNMDDDTGGVFTDENRALKCLGANLGTVIS